MMPTATQLPSHWLVTRPEPENHSLCTALTAAGYHPIPLPTLVRKPLANATLLATLPKLTHYQGVICISPTAAKIGAGLLQQQQPQHLLQPTWLAVGATTRDSLAQYQISAHTPTQENSEGLLALPSLQQAQGQQWLIIRGDQGREYLNQQLQHRQVHTHYWPVYQRCPITLDAQPLLQALPKDVNQHPGIIATSHSGLKHLMHSFKRIQSKHLQALGHVQLTDLWLLTSSQRLTQLSRAQGFKQVITAPSARTQDLLNTLASA